MGSSCRARHAVREATAMAGVGRESRLRKDGAWQPRRPRTYSSAACCPGPGAKKMAMADAVRISNADKVLYPATGFTKGHVVDYYRAVAPVLVPHLRGRALTLRRFPDGVDGESFFEKRCPPHAPKWVRRVE